MIKNKTERGQPDRQRTQAERHLRLRLSDGEQEAFGRGRTGISELYVAKDRPGYVRQLGPVGKNKMVHAATLTLVSKSEAERPKSAWTTRAATSARRRSWSG